VQHVFIHQEYEGHIEVSFGACLEKQEEKEDKSWKETK